MSPEGRYVLMQTGAPDYNLHQWSWEKSKILATVRIPMQITDLGPQMRFNPNDNTQISVCTTETIKLFRYLEGQMKPMQIKLNASVSVYLNGRNI